MATNPDPREGTLATRLPDPEPERDSRLLDAVGGLFDQLIDRILLSPERVTSAVTTEQRGGGGGSSRNNDGRTYGGA